MDKWQEILKLLKRSEDSSTTERERIPLVDQAEYLMAKFGFETIVSGNTEEVRAKSLGIKNPYALKKNVLLNNIGIAFGCVSVIPKNSDTFLMFGYDGDRARALMLYNSLVIQMFIGLHQAQAVKPVAMHGKKYNSLWVNNYISDEIARVQRNVTQAKRDSKIGELLLRNRHLAVITEVTN